MCTVPACGLIHVPNWTRIHATAYSEVEATLAGAALYSRQGLFCEVFPSIVPHSIFSSILPSTVVMPWSWEDSKMLLLQELFLAGHSCEHTSLLNASSQGIQIQLHRECCLQYSHLCDLSVITISVHILVTTVYFFFLFLFSMTPFCIFCIPIPHSLPVYAKFVHCEWHPSLHFFDATPLLQLYEYDLSFFPVWDRLAAAVAIIKKISTSI